MTGTPLPLVIYQDDDDGMPGSQLSVSSTVGLMYGPICRGRATTTFRNTNHDCQMQFRYVGFTPLSLGHGILFIDFLLHSNKQAYFYLLRIACLHVQCTMYSAQSVHCKNGC